MKREYEIIVLLEEEEEHSQDKPTFLSAWPIMQAPRGRCHYHPCPHSSTPPRGLIIAHGTASGSTCAPTTQFLTDPPQQAVPAHCRPPSSSSVHTQLNQPITHPPPQHKKR
ncbi:Hypothetical predicted protein [Prunus dulcis]|uniref:Uncharacterized protein n=1 Tax=Prunus dulcis TaxID=3755 RepID=A0A5E4F1P1_PRUDU|nr:Hypothetical predicted protein [Prunus dulcis]